MKRKQIKYKKERYRKRYRYDDDNYWKNEVLVDKKEKNPYYLEEIFAAGAGAKVAKVPLQIASSMYDYGFGAGQINTMFNTVGAGEAILGGAALGSSLAVVGAAGAGYLAGSVISSLFSQTNNQEVVGSIMPGTYQGKFALSAKKSTKGLRDKYQKRGAVFIDEVYGTVQDPDIVYLGHSTFSQPTVANVISLAILRKLFRVGAKIDVNTVQEELPLLNRTPDSGPNAFQITYIVTDGDGAETKYDHIIPNDASLLTLIYLNQNAFVLYNNIFSSMSDANPLILTQILLYEYAGANNGRLVYRMDMAKEILSIAMSSHMVIQNRTKTATGSLEGTNVDAQPVKGPVYQFSIGIPKLKAPTPIQLNVTTNLGVLLARSGEFAGTDANSFKEVPVKKAFQSVEKAAYVRLNPGALKSMDIGTDCKGYFPNVLRKMRCTYDQNILSYAYGKSQLVCFEEEMNSGSTNNINITYECQHTAGADLTTTNSPNMQPHYVASTYNNVPA